MASNSEEKITPDPNPEPSDEVSSLFFNTDILAYVQNNPTSSNTKLYLMLALLRVYVPDSYLTIQKCQQILGSPDPVHKEPPFEERMGPFFSKIKISGQAVKLVIKDETNTDLKVELQGPLADLGISTSSIACDCIDSLYVDLTESGIAKLLKVLLTQRKWVENSHRDQFSQLIEDICNSEGNYEALSVLEKASSTFTETFVYPQTLARLYYQKDEDFEEAEHWAKEAISRDETNSYTADTLGQVYKNWLKKRPRSQNEVQVLAKKAIEAFKDVEKKAEETSDDLSFNNRGHFGFIQVAKILYEKYRYLNLTETLKSEFESKFEFFEWYLSYSQLHGITVEPDYFWRDIAFCYKKYTSKNAADSTSFPALLDWLNHDLFVSKEKRAFKFQVTEKTQEDLEQTRDELKTRYEHHKDDVKVAERYILSNIILSNKEPYSPPDSLVRELQSILQRFLLTRVNIRDPEFYLLVLLLFWPEEQFPMDQETGTQNDQSSSGLNYDLEKYVNLMEEAYDEKYNRYLRGRYLLPLFFLGKGSGLSRWIHKSRLDREVELMVETELGSDRNRNKEKRRKINDMWKSGKAWKLPNIQNMLQPVPDVTFNMQDIAVVHVGGKEIKAKTESKSGTSASSNMCYLGFNIRGPVIFRVEAP